MAVIKQASVPSVETFGRVKARRSFGDVTIKVLAFIILILITAIMLLPLFIMVTTALKDQQSVMVFPPEWIPRTLHWDNFYKSMTSAPFGVYFKNTTVYSVVGTIGEVISSAIVAYGFSRYNGFGRDTLFYTLLLTMMIPYPATMIPQFVLFKELGWINTYLPLIVPSFFASGYIVFLLRQFFNSLPTELFEAARLDGCGEFRAFWQIALPLSKPALTAAAIFGFTSRWNDYLGPLIYLNDDSKYTLSVGLASFTSKFAVLPWHYLMAATLIAVLPLVILFFFAQRFFVEGIVITGIK